MQRAHREGATDDLCALVFDVAEGVVPDDGRRVVKGGMVATSTRYEARLSPAAVRVMVAPEGAAGKDVGVLPMMEGR
jgi:hypothetical protein